MPFLLIHHSAKICSLVFICFFVYILFNNLLGLFPGMASATAKVLPPVFGAAGVVGVVIEVNHRFDRAEDVDAASGAALLVRTEAIERLAIDGELFDETFFAYHEDTDLGWRARRLGYRVRYEPAAVAVHARGWKKAGRNRVPVAIRRHSFKNHYLQLVKNEPRRDFIRNAPSILGWEILRFGFTVLRDPRLLPAYVDAARALPDAFRKRRLIAARACEGVGRS